MHCTRSRNDTDLVCQYARHLCSIDGGSICLLYICIVLDLGMTLIWCAWYVRPLCSIDQGGSICLHIYIYIYMHCTRSRNDTDLVYQYARHLCLIDGGVYLPPIYICILIDLGMTLIWCNGM